MENKVLVKLIVPQIDTSFDLFIPVNELIWKIKKLMIKAVSDITNIPFDLDLDYILLNKDNLKIYTSNELVIQTDIRNGTELILITRV